MVEIWHKIIELRIEKYLRNKVVQPSPHPSPGQESLTKDTPISGHLASI